MTPEPPLLLLRVAATWPLPGLGLLALSDAPNPYLTACDLHTALAVAVQLPDGTRRTGLATVEEVCCANNDIPTRGLLLDLAGIRELPEGVTVWLDGLVPALV